MEDVLESTLTNPQVRSKLRITLTGLLILLFVGLVICVWLFVGQYINSTMSSNIVESELANIREEIPQTNSQIVTIKQGDTLQAIFLKQKLPNNDRIQITKLVKDNNIEYSLKAGQKIIFDSEIKTIQNNDDDFTSAVHVLNKVTIPINKVNSLDITREGNEWLARKTTIALNKFLAKSSVIINSSFISAFKSLGLSSKSIMELRNSYSQQIDFQRQIKNGDTATIIAEKFMTKDGKFSHFGKILYVSLSLSGKQYNIYRYSHDKSPNNYNFFSEDGKSGSRNLLNIPVKFTKISSHYGQRKHPIFGHTKMHKGVDFVAPIGTPIYAAGYGVITIIGWRSGYGKFIQIKHNQALSTSYAHASSFAKNLKVGSVVKQGQLIAYVGNSGRVTGPHLHYEVKINGQNVNPLSIKTTPTIKLAGKQLVKFKQFKNNIKLLNAKLDNKFEITDNIDLHSLN